MASTVWKRVKVNVCEECGRVMDVGEQYAAKLDSGEDLCKRCAWDFVLQYCVPVAARGRQ